MANIRAPLPPSMDDEMDERRSFEAFLKTRDAPANTGLQDGMLSYYQSQIPFTEAHEERRLAREYFDCRDMLGTEKK